MEILKHLRSVCLLFLIYSTSSYGVVLNIDGGTLLGASSVNVNGTLYDVVFLDGTCVEQFNGCDENTDFIFNNPNDLDDVTLAHAASIALLEQVFTDSLLGNFDGNPILTNACFVSGSCETFTPYFISASGRISYSSVFNSDNENKDIDTGLGTKDPSIDFSSFSPDGANFAVWSQSAVVPVPAAVWLFGSSLIGLVGMKKNQNFLNFQPNQNLHKFGTLKC